MYKGIRWQVRKVDHFSRSKLLLIGGKNQVLRKNEKKSSIRLARLNLVSWINFGSRHFLVVLNWNSPGISDCACVCMWKTDRDILPGGGLCDIHTTSLNNSKWNWMQTAASPVTDTFPYPINKRRLINLQLRNNAKECHAMQIRNKRDKINSYRRQIFMVQAFYRLHSLPSKVPDFRWRRKEAFLTTEAACVWDWSDDNGRSTR